MTRALVTGGSGFIGQHLVSELVARGLKVRVLDVLLPTRALPDVDYVQGSVLDSRLVQEVMTDVDQVFHLAGLPGMWKADKADFHAVNFIGTENVLGERAGAASPNSCIARPNPSCSAPPNRATSQRKMPRLRSKKCRALTRARRCLADRLALQAAESGFPVIVGCPTMPIGPHDRNLTPPTAMLQHFLGDGRFQMYLDFIVNLVDVRDVAVGLILAMEKGRVGQRYLLGGDCVPAQPYLGTDGGGKRPPQDVHPGARLARATGGAVHRVQGRPHHPPHPRGDR